MVSAVCTLFEGHYHYGVAALVNSLFGAGYKGDVYAGYRGSLPAWAAVSKESPDLRWPSSRSMLIADKLTLHFLPLDTPYHLTNYKPDFMLALWKNVIPEAEALFYFDPDIIATSPWLCFEQWVTCGIALCEDVNSPMAEFHPTRVSWRRYFQAKGVSICFKNNLYVNGGFVGVSINHQGFLSIWKHLQEAMAPAIGGLQNSFFTDTGTEKPFTPFAKTDQDALNATVEAWTEEVSIVGKEGMAFIPGLPLMAHALGAPKPWQQTAVVQMVMGRPPRMADRLYWRSSNYPIKSQSYFLVKRKIALLKIAALIGRFYRRH